MAEGCCAEDDADDAEEEEAEEEEEEEEVEEVEEVEEGRGRKDSAEVNHKTTHRDLGSITNVTAAAVIF